MSKKHDNKGRISLSLHAGAKVCCRCGWCCKQTICGFGAWDNDRKQCKALVRLPDGSYGCDKYEEIVTGKDESWKVSPAFGAGCCSSGNSDRRAMLEHLGEEWVRKHILSVL